jgi:cell division protein ZapE
VRGIYLWGGVGRGKTFLMDLFRARLAVPSRRDHFHRFMKDVHGRLRLLREVESPLEQVAAEIGRELRVLCLDELFVGDIADAMLLSGLFSGLVDRGVTLVFTSNAPPSDLYRGGLQRSRFLPAIALIERCTETVNVDAGLDYRLRQLEKAPLYLDAADPSVDEALARRFEQIAGEPGEPGGVLEVEGRPIAVRRRSADVVWFEFDAICAGPRGTADYVEIARDFHRAGFGVPCSTRVPTINPALHRARRRVLTQRQAGRRRWLHRRLSRATPQLRVRAHRSHWPRCRRAPRAPAPC